MQTSILDNDSCDGESNGGENNDSCDGESNGREDGDNPHRRMAMVMVEVVMVVMVKLMMIGTVELVIRMVEWMKIAELMVIVCLEVRVILVEVMADSNGNRK